MSVQPAQHGRRFTSRPLTAQHDELVTYCGCGPTGGAPGRFPWKGEMGSCGQGKGLADTLSPYLSLHSLTSLVIYPGLTVWDDKGSSRR